MPIAARSSKSRVCSTANSPVRGFRENSCLADSVLIRYVTLEKRSESTAYEKEEQRVEGEKNNYSSIKEDMCGVMKGKGGRATYIFKIANHTYTEIYKHCDCGH